MAFALGQLWPQHNVIDEHIQIDIGLDRIAALEMEAERELPVVAPLELDGRGTLSSFKDFRFAVYPKRGGRAPGARAASITRAQSLSASPLLGGAGLRVLAAPGAVERLVK